MFNLTTLSSFYLRLYGVGHRVKDHSDSRRETRCRHYMSYSFRLAARDFLYAPSHRSTTILAGATLTLRQQLYDKKIKLFYKLNCENNFGCLKPIITKINKECLLFLLFFK